MTDGFLGLSGTSSHKSGEMARCEPAHSRRRSSQCGSPAKVGERHDRRPAFERRMIGQVVGGVGHEPNQRSAHQCRPGLALVQRGNDNKNCDAQYIDHIENDCRGQIEV